MFEFEAMGSFFIDAPLIIHLLTVCFIKVFYSQYLDGLAEFFLEKKIFLERRGGGGGTFLPADLADLH